MGKVILGYRGNKMRDVFTFTTGKYIQKHRLLGRYFTYSKVLRRKMKFSKTQVSFDTGICLSCIFRNLYSLCCSEKIFL